MLMSLVSLLFLWVIGQSQAYSEEEIDPIDCACSDDNVCEGVETCESEYGKILIFSSFEPLN